MSPTRVPDLVSIILNKRSRSFGKLNHPCYNLRKEILTTAGLMLPWPSMRDLAVIFSASRSEELSSEATDNSEFGAS